MQFCELYLKVVVTLTLRHVPNVIEQIDKLDKFFCVLPFRWS